MGLVELTGIARSILAQPQFLGRYAEVYYWINLLGILLLNVVGFSALRKTVKPVVKCPH